MHRDRLRAAGPQGAAIAGLGKVERMHTSAIKNMHEHLIKKFPQTFDRCSPGAPMRHPYRPTDPPTGSCRGRYPRL